MWYLRSSHLHRSFECLCTKCVPALFPSPLQTSFSYFLFNLLCSLFVLLPFVAPHLPSPSPISLPVLQFSLSFSLDSFTITFSFSLSCMIDATIYFPWDPRGIWKGSWMCKRAWIVCNLRLSYSRGGLMVPNIHPTSASDTGSFSNSSSLLYRQTDGTESSFTNSIQLNLCVKMFVH